MSSRSFIVYSSRRTRNKGRERRKLSVKIFFQIDIFQVSVLEFLDEESRSLYHLEHFIEGDYIKYNSNSGFVSDVCRKTPQASNTAFMNLCYDYDQCILR